MRRLAICGAVLMLAACTAQQRGYEPVVDVAASGRTQGEYRADLDQCQALAAQQNTAQVAATSTAVGAAAGAATGTLLGVFGGRPAHGLWRGAAVGGLGGLGYGAWQGWAGQNRLVSNCLRGRGYSVLS
ncbi:hypothetical protein SH611_10340 (plasmid) [Geminicoccaceae bacterium 1502E]|uniref:Glycine zipper family protein n=1 Tax=Marinimicrococcus flavescens TaxID=3031815 RepID=A0AAP3UXE1_9PROT|nr:hypothetical protein [Marinimicrococcus flavescens]MDX6750204.1 hypothetical protein [Geminicoccaceae bacterium 1502E]